MDFREHSWLSGAARNIALAFLTIALFVTSAAAGLPPVMNYQGCLADSNGNVRTGSFRMTFRLFSDSTSGIMIWSESYANVAVDRGVFSVLLGSANQIPASLFSGDKIWLETAVDDTTLAPRRMLASIGYAFRSAVADSALVTASPRIVSGTICADGTVCGGSGFVASLIPPGSGGSWINGVVLSGNKLSRPGLGTFLSSLSDPYRTVMLTCNGVSQFWRLETIYTADSVGLTSSPPPCVSPYIVTKDMTLYNTFVITYTTPFLDTPHVFATWNSDQGLNSTYSMLRLPTVINPSSSAFRSQCSISMYYGPAAPSLPGWGSGVDFIAIGR